MALRRYDRAAENRIAMKYIGAEITAFESRKPLDAAAWSIAR